MNRWRNVARRDPLDALRKYTAAVRLANAGDDAGAIPLLEAATQADTSFAIAYRKLAAMLSNTRGSKQAEIDAATKAYTHRDRLPELERDQTEAFYHGNVDYDIPKTIAAYQAVLAMRPNDEIALIDLGLAFQRQGQYAAAESLYTHTLALNGASPTGYVDLISVQSDEGRFAAADTSLARLVRAAPASAAAVDLSILLPASERRLPRADSLGRAALRRAPAHSPIRRFATVFLAQVSITRGRLAEATQRTRDAMAIAEEHAVPGQYLLGGIALGDMEVRYRNRPAAGLTAVSAALARHPFASMPPADRPYAELARFYVSAGRVDDARRTLEEYDRTVPGERGGGTACARPRSETLPSRRVIPLTRSSTIRLFTPPTESVRIAGSSRWRRPIDEAGSPIPHWHITYARSRPRVYFAPSAMRGRWQRLSAPGRAIRAGGKPRRRARCVCASPRPVGRRRP